MNNLVLAVLALLAGLVVLVAGANLFVGGAAALARRYGVSPLLVGIFVVGLGTSAPELLVSANASLKGAPGIALGNAYGSNIANILLVLGFTALIRPVRVGAGAIRLELPLLLAVSGLAVVLLLDGTIGRIDAAILITALGFSLFLSVRQARRTTPAGDNPDDTEKGFAPQLSTGRSAMYLVGGLAGMLAGSELLVGGASAIALRFGVSDLIIGLTIVSIGTSLPELASSLVASSKGEDELMLGNIIGSNTLNTLGVVGLAGLIKPLRAEPGLLHRDLPVMAAATVLLYLFCRGGGKTGGMVSRWEGALLFLGYLAYLAFLLHTALAPAG